LKETSVSKFRLAPELGLEVEAGGTLEGVLGPAVEQPTNATDRRIPLSFLILLD
jgi:hypothetical protein